MKPDDLPPLDKTRYKTSRLKGGRWRYLYAGLAIILTLVVGSIIYIMIALGPVDKQATGKVRFVVEPGQTARVISVELHKQGLIRDPAVFQLYTQLTGAKSLLRAGSYKLSKADSLSVIVAQLSGEAGNRTDQVVTILPGLSLHQLSDPDFEGSLAHQGYTASEINQALQKQYDSPLLANRPAGASLEGYIYPDTYHLNTTDNLEQAFELSFAELEQQIKQHKIEERLKEKGLSLHQGIILASLVQGEVSDPQDQKQVAQVFLRRLSIDMVLGSDVSFFYIAKKEGRTPRVNDPSPFNTRIHPGLPPGPVSNFHFSALEAVVDPAPGEFLYFVSGDDGITHFSMTEAEHDENVAKYCTKLCE